MSLRVLVVEDDREIRALLQSSLAVEGFEVQTAVSVSEAQRAAAPLSCPTWSLLDLGLPDGDGVELVREFDARPRCPSSWSRPATRRRRRSSCSMPAPTTT